MTNEAFWQSTPRQFLSLVERYNRKRKQEDRRSGEIIALLFNANKSAKVEAIDWTDVFPEWKEVVRPQSEDEMLQAMQMWVTTTKGQRH